MMKVKAKAQRANSAMQQAVLSLEWADVQTLIFSA